MKEPVISLKKRAIIIFIFVLFLAILFFVSLFVKKTPFQKGPFAPSPTLVPIEVSGKNGVALVSAKIESSPSVANNNLGEVFFDYQTKNIPKSGTVYTQAPTSIPAETISKIQEKLIAGGTERIINTPSGQVILMQKEGKTLTIYLYSRTISYSDTTTSPPSSSDVPALTKKAVDFITSLGLPFDKSTPTVRYFIDRTGDLIQTTDLASADLIDISFKELVQELTVYRQFGSDAATHVWFSNTGAIKKFTYFYTPQYLPQKSIILPTLQEAEDMVKKNKGIIVGLGDDYQQVPLKSPTRTIFTSVEVGYFNSGYNTLLFPIFVFKGNSLTEGTTKPITLYLPAY
jgi:hypothetical protein